MKASTKHYRLWLKLMDAKRAGDTLKMAELQIKIAKLQVEKENSEK